MKKLITLFIFALIFNSSFLIDNCMSQWMQMSNGMGNASVPALAYSGNNIFAGAYSATYKGICLSTNNGTTWTQTALNNISVMSLAIRENNIFAGAEDYPVGSGGVYLSTNNGANWTPNLFTPIQNVWGVYINEIPYFPPMQCIAGTDNGLYLSTNNGTNWTQSSLNNDCIYAFAVCETNIFAGGDFGVYLSTNNGTNWLRKNQGFSVIPLINATLIANNYIFAGTSEQSVWRRSLSEIIGIQNISSELPAGFKLYQNYPNPFNPATVISFQLSVVGQVVLKVYDALGREVATLVNETLQPGTYSVDWDASQFSGGIYFCNLRTKDFSKTIKISLTK